MRGALLLLVTGCSSTPPLHAWRVEARDAGALTATVHITLRNDTGADLFYEPCDLVLERRLTSGGWESVGPGGSRYTCPSGLSRLSRFGEAGWPADVAGTGPHRFSLQLRGAGGAAVSTVLTSNEFMLP